ncbi:hypothetical protein [Antrihabitans stalactiti]|uniref:Uncharacterized protein n=1 Tax=Antrihabitans stalactiti TaxID=2584121 RepID=A0A848KKH9_9NOCA|nr:hypothetical protein [Antrihabitans stalactiti]NMN97484.1 hypothetical protein [Antrihabitans stalactiti]
MTSKTVKAFAASLLITAGVFGAAGVAQAEQTTSPDGTVTYYCTSGGVSYSVGKKLDGQVCQSDGTWKRLKPIATPQRVPVPSRSN